jgi:hypothetical protein
MKRYSQFRGEVRRHPVWNCRDAIKEREQREHLREIQEWRDKLDWTDPLFFLVVVVTLGTVLYQVFGG